MGAHTDAFATPYNQGYRDGQKAHRERQESLEKLQIPVCYVGSPDVLERVSQEARHMALLTRENVSDSSVALYADPVAASRGRNTLSEIEWKLLNSLECTAAWLENGGDVKQAIEELKLNVSMLRGVRRAA
jgi:hypothetical protein